MFQDHQTTHQNSNLKSENKQKNISENKSENKNSNKIDLVFEDQIEVISNKKTSQDSNEK